MRHVSRVANGNNRWIFVRPNYGPLLTRRQTVGRQPDNVHGPVGCSDTCCSAARLGEKKTRICCSRWLLGLGSIYNLNSENFMLGLRVDSTLSKSPSLNKYHRWCACGKFNSICRKYMQYLYLQIYLLKNWIKIFLIILIMYHKY